MVTIHAGSRGRRGDRLDGRSGSALASHYAIASLGEGPITGGAIGKAFLERFKQGGFPSNTYDAANAIVKTYAALQAGQNIDLDGVSHHAYFDASGQAL